MISFFVAGVPQCKGSWRSVGKGRLIPDNPAEKSWSALVGWEAKIRYRMAYESRGGSATPAPLDGFVRVGMAFVLPPPHGRKNRRDIDKLTRSVLDALTGIVYVDDEQVTEIDASKAIAERGHGVHIHITRPTKEN